MLLVHIYSPAHIMFLWILLNIIFISMFGYSLAGYSKKKSEEEMDLILIF